MRAKAGHLVENAEKSYGVSHTTRAIGEHYQKGYKEFIRKQCKKYKTKNEIWRRITRPGLFGKLEISNSPNRYPGIDIIVSI